MVDKDKCIGCASCEGVCPVEAIKLKDDKAEIDTSKCMRCYSCEGICPVDAIRIDDDKKDN